MIIGWEDTLLRLFLAAVFGGLIGWERERKDWVAGIRTHTLVSVGSCLIMIVSVYGFAEVLHFEHIGLDPSRVAAQVVSGIGFIGAGTILFLKKGAVRGVTTAAGLWTVAAIGLATGGGLYFAAGATTIIVLIILWGFQMFELNFSKKYKHKTLIIVASKSANTHNIIQKALKNAETQNHQFKVEHNENDVTIELSLSNNNKDKFETFIDDIKSEGGIKEIHWI